MSPSYGAVDACAALCARLRAPGGVSALGTAAVGSAAPHVAATLLSLSPDGAVDGCGGDGASGRPYRVVNHGKSIAISWLSGFITHQV